MLTRGTKALLWRTAFRLSSFALLAGLASVVSAQDAPATAPAPAAQDDSSGVIGEVVVKGIRQSYREALAVKMSSEQVVDAISSDDIGQLPDVTIAESINRLPGVNATRDRGNDRRWCAAWAHA